MEVLLIIVGLELLLDKLAIIELEIQIFRYPIIITTSMSNQQITCFHHHSLQNSILYGRMFIL